MPFPLTYFSAAPEILPSKSVFSHFSRMQYLFTSGREIPAQIDCCIACQQHFHLIPRGRNTYKEILLVPERVFKFFRKRNGEIDNFH